MVRIAGRKTTHTLLLDVTRPLQEFMRWVAVKFLIDEADIPNWSLFNKEKGRVFKLIKIFFLRHATNFLLFLFFEFNAELSLDKSVTQQSAESTFHFYLVKKGEHPDLVHSHESNPGTPGTPNFLALDEDEAPLNGSIGVTRDRKDSVFDTDNPDLQVCDPISQLPLPPPLFFRSSTPRFFPLASPSHKPVLNGSP
jgi:hypothetical protein